MGKLQETFDKVEGCHLVAAIDFVQKTLKRHWSTPAVDWQSSTWNDILDLDNYDDNFCSDCIGYFQDFLKAIY